jgi:hypothetical protein
MQIKQLWKLKHQAYAFIFYLIILNLFFTLPLSLVSIIIVGNYYNTLVENAQNTLLIRSKAIAANIENSIKDHIVPSERSKAFLSRTILPVKEKGSPDSIYLEWQVDDPIFVFEQIKGNQKIVWKFEANFIVDKLLDTDPRDPEESLILQNTINQIGVSDHIEDGFKINSEWYNSIYPSKPEGLSSLLSKEHNGNFVVISNLPSLPFQIVLVKSRKNFDATIVADLFKISISFLLVLIFVATVSYFLAKNLDSKRKEEIKLKSLLHNLPLGSSLVDQNFTIIISNKIMDSILEEHPTLWEQIQKEAIFRIQTSKKTLQKYVWEVLTDKSWEVTLSPWLDDMSIPEGYTIILRDLTAKKIIFEHEMEMARAIQEEYLPNDQENFEGLSFKAYYKPYLQVGGDYYDFIQLDTDKYLFVMADVIGHGLQAAMMMTVVKVIFLQIASTCTDPEEMLSNLNKSIVENLPSGKSIVPLHFLILNTKHKTFQYANAGHPGMIFIKDKSYPDYNVYERLNPVIGLTHLAETQIINGSYTENSRFFLFTDGLMDVKNFNEDMYGDKRILEFCIQNRKKSPEEFTTNLEESILGFSEGENFPDDITWFVIDSD